MLRRFLFSLACWETEKGDLSGESTVVVFPGTNLILKNVLLLFSGMSVTVFLMLPFSSMIFSHLMCNKVVSLSRF